MAQALKAQKTIGFYSTPEDAQIIWKIALRAVAVTRAFLMASKGRVDSDSVNTQAWAMDISAVHCNGMPLRLTELLMADDFNFNHDVFGIRRHLDRETGELGGCFVPRFAVQDRG